MGEVEEGVHVILRKGDIQPHLKIKILTLIINQVPSQLSFLNHKPIVWIEHVCKWMNVIHDITPT